MEFQVFQRRISDSLMRERLLAALSGFFGGLATLLASIGLYGVLAYQTVRRRGEIGHRAILRPLGPREHAAREQTRPAAGEEQVRFHRAVVREHTHELADAAADREVDSGPDRVGGVLARRGRSGLADIDER